MIRFLNQFDKGNGDYTNDRQYKIKNLSIEEISKDIETKKKD